ncbi:hypothetical protein F4809DRAFT_601445 [Biscogniauxia mediterranea]|nr:hypothetical protein F4809DRAFT_601445 [Biscogniauxia mediterranea]
MASFLTILILLFWQYALEFFGDKSPKSDDGEDSDNKQQHLLAEPESHQQHPTTPRRRRTTATTSVLSTPAPGRVPPAPTSTIVSDDDIEHDESWDLFRVDERSNSSGGSSISDSRRRSLRSIRSSINLAAYERRLAFEKEIVDLQSSLCSTKDELDKERNAHINTERELHEKQNECDELRRHWKCVTSQLTQVRPEGQAFPPITDDSLIQATQRLRFRIHSFAVQYFGDELTFNPRVDITEVAPFDKYTWSTKSWKKIQTSYLKSPTRRPILVQAYLWRSIVNNVFGCFLWAAGCHWSVWNLYSFLYPESTDLDNPADIEAERKVSLWRAVTTRLLLSKMDMKGEAKDTEVIDSFKNFLHLKIMKDLRLLIKGPVDNCLQDLKQLVDEAVNLDKLISQQASNIFWDYGDETWSNFDPTTMTMVGGEKATQGNQEVLMVVAPAMMKQGRDSGEDFHLVTRLLPAEVSCAKRKGIAFWK